MAPSDIIQPIRLTSHRSSAIACAASAGPMSFDVLGITSDNDFTAVGQWVRQDVARPARYRSPFDNGEHIFGIAGFIGRASDANVKPQVERIISVVVHSGSSSSILQAATTFLDKTGDLAISLNSEIFNYVERREELLAKGVYISRGRTPRLFCSPTRPGEARVDAKTVVICQVFKVMRCRAPQPPIQNSSFECCRPVEPTIAGPA